MFEAVAWTHLGGVGQHDGVAVILQTIDQTTPVVGRFDGDLSDAVLVRVQQGKDGGQVAGEFFCVMRRPLWSMKPQRALLLWRSMPVLIFIVVLRWVEGFGLS
jgi:hypothetical protein